MESEHPFGSSDENGFLTDEATCKIRTFFDEIERCLRHASDSAHMLIGAHETMGLTPQEIERLMERYEVEVAPSGLMQWWTIEQIMEKAFMSRLRSDSALKRGPTVSDEQIKLVVSNCEGQEAQARSLGISVRQLQRRLKKINEKA